jgi:hypothetical protein
MTQTKLEIAGSARFFSSLLGLTGTDLETIGRKPVQSFNWIVDRSGHKEIALMEVQTAHRQEAWTAYFHFSRQRY